MDNGNDPPARTSNLIKYSGLKHACMNVDNFHNLDPLNHLKKLHACV